MTSSKPHSATPAEIQAADNAFTERRHDAARYREEAARLRRGAEMNLTISEELLAVALRFDELATSVEKMQTRVASRDQTSAASRAVLIKAQTGY
jgi:hypothetical protein